MSRIRGRIEKAEAKMRHAAQTDTPIDHAFVAAVGANTEAILAVAEILQKQYESEPEPVPNPATGSVEPKGGVRGDVKIHKILEGRAATIYVSNMKWVADVWCTGRHGGLEKITGKGDTILEAVEDARWRMDE